MRKIIVLMCLAAFIFTLSCVSAADQTIGGSADNGTFTELQQKVDLADNASTLILEKDYAYNYSEDTYISVNKNITIDGAGHTLDACGFKILSVKSDNVVLKNITFINADYWGSAVSVYGNNVKIYDCIFKDNRNSFETYSEGGALFINGSNTLISNCIFEHNRIGGLVNLYGGAVGICGNGTVISGCYFEDNFVSGEYSCGGGALYCDGDLDIVNSTFLSNGVSCYGSSGGAIYSKGNLSITDSVFKDNDLSGVNVYGGAVYGESVDVSNSVFDSNSIAGFTSWESSSSAMGGAIIASEVNVHGSNFTNNRASCYDEYASSKGGAIYSFGILNADDSIFENNSADKGEALWAYKVYSDLDNCTFTDNDYALVKAYIYSWGLDKYYGGSEKLEIRVIEDDKIRANATVNISINGKNYTRTTDEEGIASIAINLKAGQYNVTASYADAVTRTVVTVWSTVDGDNITKTFRNATQYQAAFRDSNGYRLKNNTEVEFNINGVFYKRLTDEDGVARLNINLGPGEYIITAKNPESGEYYSNTVRVLPNIAENTDLVKYYKNDSQYVVRLLDDEGSPVGEGVNVTFNINGVFYERTSNATGHAKLNINLSPGTYIITASYNGLMTSNTITVLPVLEAENLNMKYHDGSVFKVKLLNGQGRPYSGENVTFNVNGVFYERATGEDGVARLNINLMAGEYIITSSYNGMNIANKITISS
ncbi:MAG: hypothetical protein IJQ68_00435 [Methanobrevibacter sp.]|uniref:right-handed parallel beta-helix repeat-containing protein n=1 Tax=Methanobrevibacter sp. TaxID=66852 RepID=UPI0025F2DB6B|nr:right-handed parallel beta-helix repeat-containing protein [Methanobrevibacter sp.]MBR0270453.1 hypothetical protein [Methanobrevibacter sp.]